MVSLNFINVNVASVAMNKILSRSLWGIFYLMKFLLLVGDGRIGYPSEAPYNAIHVGAAAPTLPKAVSLVVILNMFKFKNNKRNMLYLYK